jgi:hypothetical protein
VLIGPELRALRADDGPLRTAQAAMHARIADWRDSAAVRAVDDALAAYDAGAEIGALTVLAELMAARGARDYADSFVAGLLRALGDQPLGHIALRHFHEGGRSSLVLSRVGKVTLSLETRVGVSLSEAPARRVVLTDMESRDVVLAGAMEGRLVRAQEGADGMSFAIVPMVLRTGDTSVRYGRREAMAVDRVEGRFTRLRLQRRGDIPAPARAYDLATGALIGQASADLANSRRTLMIALLGRMGRGEDAPVLAAIARDVGDTDVRWQAVRECLGLDTATGFGLLGELARRIGDPIRDDAAPLRARLLEQHPQLAALEGAPPCPA